jgi:UPF0755 protein
MTIPVRHCLLALGAAAIVGCGGPGTEAPVAHVYIPRGSTLGAVADTLLAHGVIETRWTFLVYGRLSGLSRRVRPGLYEFRLGEPWRRIRAALISGRTEDLLFTVPEGLTVRQIADLAAQKLRLARDSVREAIRDSFLAAARDTALLRSVGLTVPPALREPAEGYLLPETYRVPYDATPRDVVGHMLRQFVTAWDTALEGRAAVLGLTRHQAVTLASIVEAEARIRSEQRRIAGVYLNRLRKRMRLQADPTVIYAVELRSDKPVTRVLYRHLKERSPYNTYLVPGLPPGPIGNPGLAALRAALAPESHGYLYFVARPDGRHMFSRTAGEHMDSVAVARVLRARYQDSLDAARRDSLAALRTAGTAP